jgi:DMSO/TMAO reductase YedYZ molybdopterin-dependent catalytic subunit
VPFLDPQPDPQGKMTKWDELRGDLDWITPTPRVFHVGHYPAPKPIDVEQWKLRVTGQIERPRELTLDEIKLRPKQDVTATIECSGNGSAPGFTGAIGNCRWVGTPLAPLLRECGMKDSAIEVAFWAVDSGKEKVRNQDIEQNFARSLPMKEALRDDVLLCYEMNGAPLPHDHGAPLRLTVPGWYGIAWVKWLQQVEVRDRRLMTRFIAKDYVTLRAREEGGRQVWTETSVGPMNVKSLVARVTRRKDGTLRVSGAAWTQGRIKTVELRIDDGPWTKVTLDESHKDPHTWTFWTYDWKDAAPGEHTLVSRATDEQGRVQPTADDPEIKMKKTYWEAYAQVPRRIKI